MQALEWLNRVHAIQRERGCSFQEAKRLIGSNGADNGHTAGMTIDALARMAAAKADEIHGEITISRSHHTFS